MCIRDSHHEAFSRERLIAHQTHTQCSQVPFFFSSRRRHTRQESVSWARRCVQETVFGLPTIISVVTLQLEKPSQHFLQGCQIEVIIVNKEDIDALMTTRRG
eukprot:TRINITY_DN3075_c0_g1_i9.p1 TRINITY_DN3075_c0_g1~~TRINITY_DN3075_c0_g1_i9.p1  ORF type:complete len:102 (+),score=27.86 TRINITY_DN3075_c0_g1_i9:1-306(+)